MKRGERGKEGEEREREREVDEGVTVKMCI